MAKSAQNFHTLEDLAKRGFDPLAFRMLVLQGHYRNQVNFTWESLDAASNRLHHWREVAALRWQTYDTLVDDDDKSTDERTVTLLQTQQALIDALNDDLNTPLALQIIDEAFSELERQQPADIQQNAFENLLEFIDNTLGLQLQERTPDISDDNKQLILERQQARQSKDWKQSDHLREKLLKQGVALRDTADGTIWSPTLTKHDH